MNVFRKVFSRTPVAPPEAIVPEFELALHDLAATFGDYMTAAEVGGHFTCTEADALARVLLLSGHRDEAITWLEGHQYGDDDEDDPHAAEESIPAYVDSLV
ncbi:hypothetical protein [Streptomyces sp. NPDC092295]|uniref:hypothetical protein n=1 Tax=Streptomyces sp. NPDC092295 TaxID=3366011 RepID=UPI0037F9BE4B